MIPISQSEAERPRGGRGQGGGQEEYCMYRKSTIFSKSELSPLLTFCYHFTSCICMLLSVHNYIWVIVLFDTR